MTDPARIANKALVDALAEALAGKPNDARAIFSEYLAKNPELRSLPELGGRLAAFGLAPDAIDYEALPAATREFLASLGDPPGGPKYIAGIRVALGLTQAELAAQLGVTYSTVSKWESGARRVTA